MSCARAAASRCRLTTRHFYDKMKVNFQIIVILEGKAMLSSVLPIDKTDFLIPISIL